VPEFLPQFGTHFSPWTGCFCILVYGLQPFVQDRLRFVVDLFRLTGALGCHASIIPVIRVSTTLSPGKYPRSIHNDYRISPVSGKRPIFKVLATDNSGIQREIAAVREIFHAFLTGFCLRNFSDHSDWRWRVARRKFQQKPPEKIRSATTPSGHIGKGPTS